MFVRLLEESYRLEVESRGGKYERTANVVDSLRHVAKVMTSGTAAGLMLCGTYGLGKTTVVYALRKVIDLIGQACPSRLSTPAGLVIRSATDIARDTEGLAQVRAFPLLCIEDLGRESAETVEYGNRTAPMKELIESRYSARRFTIVTTNLTPQQIFDKYGERISDRFEEMLEKVVFEGKSFRKKTIL